VDYLKFNAMESSKYMCKTMDVKLRYFSNINFDAPDAHFDFLSLFSGTQAEKVGNPKTKL
jgi:hypothetical protein